MRQTTRMARPSNREQSQRRAQGHQSTRSHMTPGPRSPGRESHKIQNPQDTRTEGLRAPAPDGLWTQKTPVSLDRRTVGSQRLRAPSLSAPVAPGPKHSTNSRALPPRTAANQEPSTAEPQAQDLQEPRTTGAELPQGFRIAGHSQEPRTQGPLDPGT